VTGAGGEQLAEMPSLAKLYVAGAATAAKRQLVRTAPFITLPARAVEVRNVHADLAKLTEFQHLVGQPARDILPSGYVHALAFPVAMSVMVRDDFPLPLLGMVHLRNQVDHLAPIMFTDALTIRSWARNLTGHRSGTQVELVVEVLDVDGMDVLWRGVSTYLAKGVFLPGLDKPSKPVERIDFAPPARTAQWRLGVDTGRAYAAVSGDFNPIHLSVLTARALGMRRSIAHGMYAAARVLSNLPIPKSEAFSWDISFDSPIFLPATVSLNIADSLADDGAWLGSSFVAWNAHTGRRHFYGTSTALPA